MPVQILTIESQPFAENSYLVWKDGSSEAFVIDPGFEPELILDAVGVRGSDRPSAWRVSHSSAFSIIFKKRASRHVSSK